MGPLGSGWDFQSGDQRGTPGFRPKILVVDDTPSNLRAFSTLLEDQGYAVFPASSGQEALKLSLDHEFGVILLDVRMPEMDGVETAKYLRKGRCRFTPIIFVSAYDMLPMQVERGYLAGAIDYLFSPVDEEILKRKVTAFIEFYLKNLEHKRKADSLSQRVETLEKHIQDLERTLASFKATSAPNLAGPTSPVPRPPPPSVDRA
jgi:response regulator RpfG family c-di-GMP phosphodiesterase